MIYRSNLTCPDLTPHFKHLHSRPMGHSFGHDVPSDWADKADDDPVFGIYKRCGMWTHDEAAILHNCALAGKDNPVWLDIGAHTGWTTSHIMSARVLAVAVDPILRLQGFGDRFEDNIDPLGIYLDSFWYMTSMQFLSSSQRAWPAARVWPATGVRSRPTPFRFAGVCIDGDHEPGEPLKDAKGAAAVLSDDGVIMLHDGVGLPVREAVEWLMAHGFKARAYFTPHLVFCCWRGDFVPPDHVPDPAVKAAHLDGRYPDFNFERMK